MQKYECEMRRQNQLQARVIEAVAFGYSGARSSDKRTNPLQKILALLRR